RIEVLTDHSARRRSFLQFGNYRHSGLSRTLQMLSKAARNVLFGPPFKFSQSGLLLVPGNMAAGCSNDCIEGHRHTNRPRLYGNGGVESRQRVGRRHCTWRVAAQIMNRGTRMIRRATQFAELCAILFIIALMTSGTMADEAKPTSSPLSPGSKELIAPEELVKLLQSPESYKLLIIQVGFHRLYDQAHIPNSEYIGPASNAGGLQ